MSPNFILFMSALPFLSMCTGLYFGYRIGFWFGFYVASPEEDES